MLQLTIRAFSLFFLQDYYISMMKYNLCSYLSRHNKYTIGLAIAFSSLLVNIPASYGANVLDLEQEIWQIQPPPIPSLRDAEAYLHPPSYSSKLILHLSKRKVEVYQGDELIASFPVAVGKEGWETPQGEFNVIQMIKNPAWEHPWNGKIVPPGPKNPLGQRWTDGKNFIGFHGTPQENLIGQAVSHGCVRMKNKDIAQLFQLVSMGTPVTVKK